MAVDTILIAHLLVYAWLGITPVIAIATIWWIVTQVENSSRVLKSIVLSGLATLPGTVFWAEYVVRATVRWIENAPSIYGYDCLSLVLACLTIPAIPLVLLASIIARPSSGVPWSANLMQVAHAIGCSLSGFVAVEAAVAI